MTNTKSYILNIKLNGSYDITNAGNIVGKLEDILSEISSATFTITWLVLGDDDFSIEVFCSADGNHTLESIIGEIYSKANTKFSNVSVE